MADIIFIAALTWIVYKSSFVVDGLIDVYPISIVVFISYALLKYPILIFLQGYQGLFVVLPDPVDHWWARIFAALVIGGVSYMMWQCKTGDMNFWQLIGREPIGINYEEVVSTTPDEPFIEFIEPASKVRYYDTHLFERNPKRN